MGFGTSAGTAEATETTELFDLISCELTPYATDRLRSRHVGEMSIHAEQDRTVQVLHFFNAGFYADGWTPSFEIPDCHVSTDKRDLLACDCVIFHAPSLVHDEIRQLADLRHMVRNRQTWVLETQESFAAVAALNDPRFLALFDFEMSYRQSADVWTPYIPSDFEATHLTTGISRQRKHCCAFNSSNWNFSGRLDYMRELSRHMPIDSFGRFMRNKKLRNDRGITSKLRALRDYNFTLAFENSIVADYVTEKFFQPFAAGSIPVYLGAPNVEEFAPGDNSFVNAADFESPADLAQFLDEADPRAFHEWRTQPLRKNFRAMLGRIQTSNLQRLSRLKLRRA